MGLCSESPHGIPPVAPLGCRVSGLALGEHKHRVLLSRSSGKQSHRTVGLLLVMVMMVLTINRVIVFLLLVT